MDEGLFIHAWDAALFPFALLPEPNIAATQARDAAKTGLHAAISISQESLKTSPLFAQRNHA